MFRVTFFVDEKKLGKALIALVGLAQGAPEVVPVVNAVKKGNGLAAKVPSGSSLERFADMLKPNKGKVLKMADFMPLMKPLGLSDGSCSYIVGQAVTAHLLKRRGKSSATNYTVL